MARKPTHDAHTLPADRKNTIVAVRFTDQELATLDNLAAQHGLSRSDLLRHALAQLGPAHPIGWQCTHLEATSTRGTLAAITCPLGCAMTPIYHPNQLRTPVNR